MRTPNRQPAFRLKPLQLGSGPRHRRHTQRSPSALVSWEGPSKRSKRLKAKLHQMCRKMILWLMNVNLLICANCFPYSTY